MEIFSAKELEPNEQNNNLWKKFHQKSIWVYGNVIPEQVAQNLVTKVYTKMLVEADATKLQFLCAQITNIELNGQKH